MAEVTENEATKTLQREATIAFVKALRVLKPLLVMILPAMRLALVFKALRIVWFIEPPYALGLLTFLGLVLTLTNHDETKTCASALFPNLLGFFALVPTGYASKCVSFHREMIATLIAMVVTASSCVVGSLLSGLTGMKPKLDARMTLSVTLGILASTLDTASAKGEPAE